MESVKKMKLVIGGTAQGKLEYVLLKHDVQKNMVWDGVLPNDRELNGNIVIINHLHQWIKNCMVSGGCPEDEIMSFLDCNEDCIIICDEIGNGIVPIDPFEREYRERTGRILVQLAMRAEEVERIICGIGQKIK
ncbi:bifunctional adenosylcobalamin biosynthesis protein CobU [Lachnospiraceae bacterium]|jgi:adenosylcobinamide kinase/adenosylcobinamide-phosphate guanylyltransferase|nr:bifunctional adenosylcobalamin biosynthesis protein CobU [Lachnospiraceae bacterium]